MTNVTSLYRATTDNADIHEELFDLGSLTQTAADTVEVGLARAGWTIVGITVAAEYTASGTISLGDGSAAGRFLNAVALVSGQILYVGNAIDGVGYTYTADTKLILTIGAQNVSGKKYKVIVKYKKTLLNRAS